MDADDVSFLDLPDGARLRWASWRPRKPVGRALLFLSGRAEFLEKNAETCADFAAAGYEVFAFDWRGQGLSTRISRHPYRGHVADFGVYLDDLDHVLRDVVRRRTDAPAAVVAHSMGGHLALRFMARRPDAFAAAALAAPMIDVFTPPAPPTLARLAARAATALGFGDRYVFGRGDADPDKRVFEGNPLTGDPRRFRRFGEATAANPDLTVGGPSWGWLDAAFRSMRAFRAGEVGRVTTPTLILAGGDDRVVDHARTATLAARLPHGLLKEFPDARHELFLERDAIRDAVLAEILSFFDEVLGARAAAAKAATAEDSASAAPEL